jgi:hypothetical protein
LGVPWREPIVTQRHKERLKLHIVGEKEHDRDLSDLLVSFGPVLRDLGITDFEDRVYNDPLHGCFRYDSKHGEDSLFPPGRWTTLYPVEGIVVDILNHGDQFSIARSIESYILDPNGVPVALISHTGTRRKNHTYNSLCSECHCKAQLIDNAVQKSRTRFDGIDTATNTHFYINAGDIKHIAFPHNYDNIPWDDMNNMVWLHDHAVGEIIKEHDTDLNPMMKLVCVSLIRQNQLKFEKAYYASQRLNQKYA